VPSPGTRRLELTAVNSEKRRTLRPPNVISEAHLVGFLVRRLVGALCEGGSFPPSNFGLAASTSVWERFPVVALAPANLQLTDDHLHHGVSLSFFEISHFS
jgi:hypothetical protein